MKQNKKKKQITVHLTEELYEKLGEVAREQERSVSAQIRVILGDAIENSMKV